MWKNRIEKPILKEGMLSSSEGEFNCRVYEKIIDSNLTLIFVNVF